MFYKGDEAMLKLEECRVEEQNEKEGKKYTIVSIIVEIQDIQKRLSFIENTYNYNIIN